MAAGSLDVWGGGPDVVSCLSLCLSPETRGCVHSASRTLQLHAALSHAAPCAALVQGPQDFAALNKSVPTRLLLC